MKFRFLRIKVWFTFNFFVAMPSYTYFFFVFLNPKVQATGNASLQAWYEFWIWTALIAHLIYGVYVFMKINDLRERILSIEFEIDSKMR